MAAGMASAVRGKRVLTKTVFVTRKVLVQTTDCQWIRLTHWRAGFVRLTLLAICLGASHGRVLSAAEPRLMVTNSIGMKLVVWPPPGTVVPSRLVPALEVTGGPMPSVRNARMPGDSTTCTEMSGNGVLIGTLRRTTRSALRRIPSGRFKAIPGYSEVGDGRVAQPVVAARHVWVTCL